MEIKVGDFVRWTGEKLEQKTMLSNGITMTTSKLPFTDGTARRVVAVEQHKNVLVWLELEGIKGGLLVYPISLLEVVPQEQELPEYGEKILVWDDGNEEYAQERIFVVYIEGAKTPIITVNLFDRASFECGTKFGITHWKHFKRIEKDEKLEELKQALVDAQKALDEYMGVSE